MNTMIKCLPVEVQGKLRSGVAIPSLQQCVEELILNSIDAEATCVGVRMDMEAFKIQVIDNGAGINAEDMKNLGKRYYTSKCSSIEDLENLRWYGFRGEALASVVSLASLVEISSRTRSSVKTHTKLFKDGKGMDVFEAETTRPSAGTTVIICSFFHNMPVRRKRMDAVLEVERIRHRVEALSLMHPSVSFTLKNDCTGAMIVQLPKARNTYHRFVQTNGLGRAQKLGEISHTHAQFEVTGYIGREGHYNNSLQYLYVNERLLLKTRLHKLLNFLLRRLSSSSQKNDCPDGQSAIRSPKHKRSQEQHGVYIINIKCPYSEYDICLEPAKTLIEFRDWDGVLLCIEEAVKAFLCKESLVAELSQDDLGYLSSKLFGTHSTEHEWHHGSTGHQETSSASTLDCNFGIILTSHSVHRKHKDKNASEDRFCQESGAMEGKEESEQGHEKSKSNSNTECNSEPPCVTDVPESLSENTISKEKKPSFTDSREDSQVSGSSNDVRDLEKEKLDIEIQPSAAASVNNNTEQHGIIQQIHLCANNTKQILLDTKSTGGDGLTLERKRKISLCDPYIHEILQTQAPPVNNKLLFQPSSVRNCEDRSSLPKRKISLYAGQARSSQKQCTDLVQIIPTKVPRIIKDKKLSVCHKSGSLEKFRRVYGKPSELVKPSQETQIESDDTLLETNSFVLNSQDFLVSQKDKQDDDDDDDTEKGKEETPTGPSGFTKLKPASEELKNKTSLAAKLCQLKQHGTDHLKSSPAQPSTASQDSENQGDNALDSTPTPGYSADPLQAEREEASTSGDWLHHYDTSVGKTVYINKVTGLSRYEDPPTEETRVSCASDVTNMSVDVVSEMGMEYRCYPFQVDLVFPFLPKSKTERVISSGLDDRDDSEENSNSLTTLFSKWNNPVFVRPPVVGVDISSGQADGLAVKVHNILFPYRFSKDMIHSMKVIQQVDKKFLACLINTRQEKPSTPNAETEGNLLVLVDQHAAHERVRLENLVADSYEDDPDAPGERRLCSSIIRPPLEIGVTEEELRLLRSCQLHLQSLGLELEFSEATDPQVLVGKVPLCFMEKESNELRRGRASIIRPIVEEYLREQIELLCSTGRVKGTLPLTVLKVLASLACHGAIKFNHSLSRDECCSLVASLSSCQLPFQCAHGRPSIAPLVDILHLDKEQKELQRPNLRKLRRMYKAWQLYGDR